MKLIHTSDWHLGRLLYTKKRYDEFEAFLNWLVDLINSEKIDILLIAGDVFDTSTPSNKAQELYYSFLGKITQTTCRHVVVIGGNHDSPTFLDAPKMILNVLNVHVIGAVTENIQEEIIILNDEQGKVEAIVCAVPFLRDQDIRKVGQAESIEDKNEKLLQGISAHYREISGRANQLKDEVGNVPVVGMGHLFTRNAKTTDGDGVRELYIGTLAHVDEQTISEGFDYMALGHLHLAQSVEGSEKVRYSGSPLPMGFSEAGQEKKVIIVDFDQNTPTIREHTVPCTQELKKFTGDIDSIRNQIIGLIQSDSDAWLEIEITSDEILTDLTSVLDELVKESGMEILRMKSRAITEKALGRMNITETLETLDPSVVFSRCLDAYEIEEEERSELISTYSEVVISMHTSDSNNN